jgi:hypothetical protein
LEQGKWTNNKMKQHRTVWTMPHDEDEMLLNETKENYNNNSHSKIIPKYGTIN